jgi:hypothetical protein
VNKADDIYCTVLMEGSSDAAAMHVDATPADLWGVIASFEEAESNNRRSEVEELAEKLLATGRVTYTESLQTEHHGWIEWPRERSLSYTEAREMAEKAITERDALRPKKVKA